MISRRSAKAALGLEGIDVQNVVWLFLMSLMLFTLLLPFSSYVAALSFIQDEWEINNTQSGAIFSAYLAGFALAALLIIPLTDRLPPRYIFIISASISVAANVLFLLVADGIISASILRAFAGVGLVGVYTPGMRVISERFSNQGRGMAIGTFVTFFYAASSVSLAATGALMNWFDWRDAYLIMAAIAVLSIPMAYILLRNHPHVRSKGSSGILSLSVLKNAQARIYMIGYSLHAIELYAVRVWLPLFLTTVLVARGVDNAQAAITAATVGGIALAAGAIGPVMGGVLSDRMGRAQSAAAIFALSGAVSLTIGWIGDFPWGIIIGLSVVYGWAIAADSAIYSTAVTETADPEHLGSTMALQSFVGFMGGVVGPIAVGVVLDIAPDSIKWGIGFTFVGLLAVIAVAVLSRAAPLPQRNAQVSVEPPRSPQTAD